MLFITFVDEYLVVESIDNIGWLQKNFRSFETGNSSIQSSPHWWVDNHYSFTTNCLNELIIGESNC